MEGDGLLAPLMVSYPSICWPCSPLLGFLLELASPSGSKVGTGCQMPLRGKCQLPTLVLADVQRRFSLACLGPHACGRNKWPGWVGGSQAWTRWKGQGVPNGQGPAPKGKNLDSHPRYFRRKHLFTIENLGRERVSTPDSQILGVHVKSFCRQRHRTLV